MKYSTDKNIQIELVKQNITQLLVIGVYNTDEHIEKHFGGEKQLLEVINGYLDLLDRLESDSKWISK